MPAHRQPDDAATLDIQMIQQRQRMTGEIIEIAGAFRKTAGIPMPPKVRHNHPIPAGQRVDLRTPHRLVPKVTVTEQDNRPGAL
ncbi:hypothetical protein PSYMO_30763, partial [Pseudomonas amygdali pv. mori str. 301020]